MTDAANEPTPEEIQRVHEFDCRMNGHSTFHVELDENNGYEPASITCTNCKLKWVVVRENRPPDELPDVPRHE